MTIGADNPPELDGVTGQYFARERLHTPAATARSDVSAARLWAISEQMVGCSSS